MPLSSVTKNGESNSDQKNPTLTTDKHSGWQRRSKSSEALRYPQKKRHHLDSNNENHHHPIAIHQSASWLAHILNIFRSPLSRSPYPRQCWPNDAKYCKYKHVVNTKSKSHLRFLINDKKKWIYPPLLLESVPTMIPAWSSGRWNGRPPPG